MNNTTFIILAVIVALFLWGGIKCRRQSREALVDAEASEEDLSVAKWWRYVANALFAIAIIISIIFAANLSGIPNLFAPKAPESAPPTPGLVIDSDRPLVVPPTNANPSAAAERNQQLLEEAKRQQQETLGKSQ